MTTEEFMKWVETSKRAPLSTDPLMLTCPNPEVLNAVYVLLFTLIVALAVIGMISAGRWIDDKLEVLVRRRQYRRSHGRLRDALRAKVLELNGERNVRS